MGLDLDSRNSGAAGEESGSLPVPVREYAQGVSLSIVGLGALALVGIDRDRACRLVAESVGQGVNYFEAAPSYGGGEAEERLGTALRPHRSRVFLASKTLHRSRESARLELEDSLQRLRTDYLDLYQFHAVDRAADVRRIFAPGGALEAFVEAKEKGQIRFIGFSSHSVPNSLDLLDRYQFDSILFPVNFVCFARGNFGPQVLEAARARGTACMGLKSLALRPWQRGEERLYPNCWYRPMDDPVLVRLALRFALSEGVCSVLPPADERLHRMALRLARDAAPLTAQERLELDARARQYKPILEFRRGRGKD